LEELEAQQAEDLQAHDLLPADLRKLKQDLDFYNSIGRLVTFNKIIKDWVVWDRYGLVSDAYIIWEPYIFVQ
jgi:hypothetical protein